MAVAGVILDLDGTLVDSNYFHVVAWWRAFADADRPVAAADLHQSLGLPSPALVDERAPGAPDDLREQIIDGHSKYYQPLLDVVGPTPGAAELLRALHGAGLRLVVATSAKPDETSALVAATGAAEVIYDAVDSGEAKRGKPAPDPVELALARGGLDPVRTVMLGDAVWDVRAAHRAGLRCVALTCGGIDGHRLREAGADAVYADPADLLAHLGDSPVGALT
jgi:HAD superfamily hydrolase (TIGR01509 family)